SQTELKKKQKFVIKFKSKKHCKQDLNGRDYDHEKGQFSFLKEIKKSEVIDMKNKNEFVILRNKLNTYYLHIPIYLFNKKEGGIISLGPGVRLFLTGYNPGEDVVKMIFLDYQDFA
ncbi:22307_t:CDS:1, partial [Gigaspora margarita]